MEDDADQCGYPTAADTPCQHPAGDNGRCHIDAHNPDGKGVSVGRDFSISEEDHADILKAARMGLSKSGCGRAAGVGPDELRRYVDAHPDFREAFMRARFQGEQKLVKGALHQQKNVKEPHREMDGQHARFLLSTSFDYKKTERKELTGEDGGAIEVDSDVVTVTEAPDE